MLIITTLNVQLRHTNGTYKRELSLYQSAWHLKMRALAYPALSSATNVIELQQCIHKQNQYGGLQLHQYTKYA
ncbi:hypothetical protein E1A91_D03G120000v1 [Gossypium mustelinum]|uniref:Uncharacterized protein n=1 Tax=Gossypium mustelinum TaxID=34275 RepID=A0A5D2VLY4_GOSMU|nr:hypothetical protein E1A91_D03G120000v1 [Gossypium mustelinum]